MSEDDDYEQLMVGANCIEKNPEIFVTDHQNNVKAVNKEQKDLFIMNKVDPLSFGFPNNDQYN